MGCGSSTQKVVYSESDWYTPVTYNAHGTDYVDYAYYDKFFKTAGNEEEQNEWKAYSNQDQDDTQTDGAADAFNQYMDWFKNYQDKKPILQIEADSDEDEVDGQTDKPIVTTTPDGEEKEVTGSQLKLRMKEQTKQKEETDKQTEKTDEQTEEKQPPKEDSKKEEKSPPKDIGTSGKPNKDEDGSRKESVKLTIKGPETGKSTAAKR